MEKCDICGRFFNLKFDEGLKLKDCGGGVHRACNNCLSELGAMLMEKLELRNRLARKEQCDG